MLILISCFFPSWISSYSYFYRFLATFREAHSLLFPFYTCSLRGTQYSTGHDDATAIIWIHYEQEGDFPSGFRLSSLVSCTNVRVHPTVTGPTDLNACGLPYTRVRYHNAAGKLLLSFLSKVTPYRWTLKYRGPRFWIFFCKIITIYVYQIYYIITLFCIAKFLINFEKTILLIKKKSMKNCFLLQTLIFDRTISFLLNL